MSFDYYNPSKIGGQSPPPVQQSSGVSMGVVVGLILSVAFGGLAGFGLGMLLDNFRLMIINQVGDGWDSPYSLSLAFLFFFPGVLGGFFARFFLRAVLRRSFGWVAAWVAPTCTWALGATIGLLYFFPMWTPPQSIGFLQPFISGTPEPWQPIAWIAYYLPPGLPIASGALFLILALALLRSIIQQRRPAQKN